jgi:flagellar hook-associated protein 1 FlgK
VAIALARTFNDQHNLGQDLAGALGGDFFSVADPQVTAATFNTGSAQMSATFASDAASALTTANYRLNYDGANYTLLNLSDNSTETFATLPQTLHGFTLTLDSGTPAAGDSFLIRPTERGAATLTTLITDPGKVAAAAPIRTGQGVANTGTGKASAGVVDSLDPNLQQPVTITFTGPNTFDVSGTGTGNPTGLAYVPGQDISYNGWTIQISGAPADGDTFTVSSNTGGNGDNRNMLLLAKLQTAKRMVGDTASYQTAYAGLVSQVASKTQELETTSTAQATILQQAQTARDSFSAVNLDEEAANLIRYQQAYQASGKVLQIASTMFDTLLELGN